MDGEPLVDLAASLLPMLAFTRVLASYGVGGQSRFLTWVSYFREIPDMYESCLEAEPKTIRQEGWRKSTKKLIS